MGKIPYCLSYFPESISGFNCEDSGEPLDGFKEESVIMRFTFSESYPGSWGEWVIGDRK